jgi:hypothetical protein
VDWSAMCSAALCSAALCSAAPSKQSTFCFAPLCFSPQSGEAIRLLRWRKSYAPFALLHLLCSCSPQHREVSSTLYLARWRAALCRLCCGDKKLQIYGEWQI